ncbi:Oxoglutarate/iron-dependent dioxygenase [Parasponia andersonii]|uniref:Oxoglutarate/iron-dependent dioxygenase n=1 Tax=Parasponia andersonii TaxID=3476 RepID=A0A2P5AXJ5_PARAD|nr:Oxoglutarate/iron-dependent dioxygenase [Parasponia andersonii]
MGSETVVHEIPTIDFSNKDLKPGSSLWSSTCDQIRHALEEYGCFVAKYDNLSTELATQIFCQSKDVFVLPTETKAKNVSEEPFRGYLGKIPQAPLYEGLAIDKATSLEEMRQFVNLMWPNGNDQFCDIAHSYAKQLAALDEMATKLVFESYGVGKHWEPVAAVRSHVLRFLKYEEPDDKDTTVRFAAHTDKNFTTILHQNHLGGLEVQTKDGTWISVNPKPSHFLLMAGDLMKVWSNDRIRACYHRVKLSAGNGERYSIGLFTFTDGAVKVPEELVDEEHPLLYKPFDNREYIRFYVSDEAKKFDNPIKAYCGV